MRAAQRGQHNEGKTLNDLSTTRFHKFPVLIVEGVSCSPTYIRTKMAVPNGHFKNVDQEIELKLQNVDPEIKLKLQNIVFTQDLQLCKKILMKAPREDLILDL
ncbi:hypothetical protein MAR_034071 [Mya arenaria]|uniref:Uncharacterized protein n=1 Tax=Mya arenaria TaxID=6604 RepID=A0ABY7GD98_MYAAR|nr:hypothetical protein MAR_034071 [Mya arenaria]